MTALKTSPPKPPLSQLLDDQRLWRGRQLQSQCSAYGAVSSTGFEKLDRALHLGGWPIHSSCELSCRDYGIGEQQLLLPALQQGIAGGRHIAWLNPPFEPGAEALRHSDLPLERCLLVRPGNLQDQLWAAEQLLASRAFAALISWFDCADLPLKSLRRLQHAAQRGQCWHVHFRPPQCLQQPSPAHLRISLSGDGDDLQLELHKQPGGWSGQRLSLPRDRDLCYRQSKVQEWPSYRRPRQQQVRNIEWIRSGDIWPANPRQKPARPHQDKRSELN